MNPGLPLLLLACLLPWLIRRRDATVAWALIGLVSMALLWPALSIADGIPSPSATLARLEPWKATLAADGEGQPHSGGLDDVTFQVEPWLLFLRHELRAGRLPLWNPHQSSGTPYWANGSSAPLFPLHLLFALLPVQLGFILLPWLRLVIGGLGAWWLARELDVDHGPALLTGLIFPLSGRLVGFLLYPMANALCLVPWIFVACERLASGRRGARLLAGLTGLQLLAGHPETAVMTALLSTVYLLVRGGWRGLRLVGSPESGRERAIWGRFVAGWAIGGAIAAIQLLPLAFYLFDSTRWSAWQAGEPMSLALASRVALRFFLPDAWGHPASGDFWGPFNFVSTSIYCGAITLPLALAGAVLERRDRRWLAVVAMTLFALLGAFGLPPIEPLLMILPVVRKGLHHYLAFGFSLGLALLAAVGLHRWLRATAGGVAVGVLAGSILTFAALASAWWMWAGEWATRGQTGRQLAATVVTGGLVLLLLASLLLSSKARWRWLPLLLSLVAVDLWLAHHRANPGLSAARLYPPTQAVEWLGEPDGQPYRVAATSFALRPNAAMVYGLYDVRGDDSLKLANYEKLYGEELGRPHPTFFRPLERWDSPWLDRLGVRWVLTPPGAAASAAGWRLRYDGEDARLFERPTALPLVRWLPVGDEGPSQGDPPRVVVRSPGRWQVAWALQRPARLLIAETWAPGWRAEMGGRAVEIERVDGVLMAVEVAAGEGELELTYRPPGLLWGTVLSALGLLALFGLGRLEPRPPVH